MLGTSNGLRTLYGLQRLGVYQQGDWFYPQADALGSVRQWTDAQGAVLGLQGYGPYGEALVPIGPPLAPWGYTGEWQDASGLVYLRARWYNPTWGRFTQADPLPGASTQPQSLHRYLYARANPLRYADPSGLWPGDPPPPRGRYLFEKWMRDVGLPWLYYVYTKQGWGGHWGIDFATVARGYIAGEAAAYYSEEDRGEIVAQSILDAMCHTYGLDPQTNMGLDFIRVPIIEGLRHTDMLALGTGALMERQAAQFTLVCLVYGGIVPLAGEPNRLARGNTMHYERLEAELARRYPKTVFKITPRGAAGGDVEYISGLHPPTYPGSTWPEGFDFAEMKPATASGWRNFIEDFNSGKIDPMTVPLLYDPQTLTLLDDVP